MITIDNREFVIRQADTMTNFQTLETLRLGLAAPWSKQPLVQLTLPDAGDLLMRLSSDMLDVLRQRLFALVQCRLPGQQHPRPLTDAEDVCFNGLRPSAVYDVMMAAWQGNFPNLTDDLTQLTSLLDEAGISEAAGRSQLTIGDVTFNISELKGFPGWQALEDIRDALASAKEHYQLTAPMAAAARSMTVPETLLHIPPAALRQVRERLFSSVGFMRDDDEGGILAGNEAVAFANLGAGAVYRVMAHAAAVNFSDCYPETTRLLSYAQQSTSPLLQGIYTRFSPLSSLPDTPATLIAESALL